MYNIPQNTALFLICSLLAYVFLIQNGWTTFKLSVLDASLNFMKNIWEPHTLKITDDFNLCIIGAEASCICMNKELNEIGVQYVILEKSSTLGGTWWENIYPGVARDVPSHLYSFSFYTNPNKGPKIIR